MIGRLLALAMVVACALADCEGPFCKTIATPCANKQVSTCEFWPHHCSAFIHGGPVYCSEDHQCLCGEGTCATATGKCKAPPIIECETKVSTCHVWPHHCAKAFHGPSVYCNMTGKDCLCGDGTCKTEDGVCKPTPAFGAATDDADPSSYSALAPEAATKRGIQLAAVLSLASLVALAVACGVAGGRWQQPVQTPPLLLG
mmetsp:Transcript_82099/g.254900  ORF Transcript_82099/g.254900 Transcript_82099/m.254900 type:complete len:200 (+) Transcript_82099:49-648(+)|eukprot:CAMPEP_0204603450 /NCGR_PEP_ID=MMETSP0661-20131031/57274_1 /ASSEMBLY_ACC=CAM_ASM_000606 /TAXON_ID=109239 /ORGANISM="Alexandrium margalefi, Strain AMGDE01CS-322" /LENGTH=199 /DNA_ID=CAMNT_0051614511 /DNA_START=49 /DNA_END=648 /DNA_ORIENTATION=-